MFTQKSFEIFKIEGLEPRMTEIRSEIQPVFSEIGQKVTDRAVSKNSKSRILLSHRSTSQKNSKCA